MLSSQRACFGAPLKCINKINNHRGRTEVCCSASMGIGFKTGHEGLAVPSKELVVPEYGLSLDQMRILGLTNDTSFMKLPEVKAVCLVLSLLPDHTLSSGVSLSSSAGNNNCKILLWRRPSTYHQ